jgi:uncharacterized protein (DUF2384 family)
MTQLAVQEDLQKGAWAGSVPARSTAAVAYGLPAARTMGVGGMFAEVWQSAGPLTGRYVTGAIKGPGPLGVITVEAYPGARIAAFKSAQGQVYRAVTTAPVRSETPPVIRPGRITGPVRVLMRIAREWRLSRDELANLLAYPEIQIVDDLLNGRVSLREDDREDRVRLMYQIYRILVRVFADPAIQSRWLRSPNPLLSGRVPLDVMRIDRIPGMILVRNLVDRLAGR